jgi:hypothetical protein|tara:strand:- start:1476 stop:1655 length:180 start_codon:yes stop_codon:yes gene_type:complete
MAVGFPKDTINNITDMGRIYLREGFGTSHSPPLRAMKAVQITMENTARTEPKSSGPTPY